MTAPRVRIGFKTSPQNVDWATLDATWATGRRAAGPGPASTAAGSTTTSSTEPATIPASSARESLTLLATLVHHVPGLTVGHAVLSNTFRQPVLVAKAATVLDHVTDGRFVLGLGAGWFEGEHDPFGIALPPIGPRIDRLVSAVDTIRALFSPEAVSPPGRRPRDDPFYPLERRRRTLRRRGRPAARRSTSVARRPAASRSRRAPEAAGSCRGHTPATSRTSRRSGTPSSRHWSRRVATRQGSTSSAR